MNDGRIMINNEARCIACKKKLAECTCLWRAIRELQNQVHVLNNTVEDLMRMQIIQAQELEVKGCVNCVTDHSVRRCE